MQSYDGIPTEEWDEPPSLGLMLCQTSTQEILQTHTINEKMKKGNSIIMHVGNTILAASSDARINENRRLLDN